MRRHLPALVAGTVCSVAAVDVAFSVTASGDYQAQGAVAGDNAAPAIDALVHGNLGAFASHQPLMGPVSLLLRVPFTALATALGGGQLVRYEAGALACLVVVAAFAAWLVTGPVARAMRREGRAMGWLAGLFAAYALLGPVTHGAIGIGHPEEPLTAVLVCAAVLAALAGRDVLAAVALGLAVATKEWALIGVVPVLAALPARRVRCLALAGGIAALLYAPGVLLNPSALPHAGDMLADKKIVNPLSMWWPLGGPFAVVGHAVGDVRLLPDGFTRERLVEVAAACTPLIALAAWAAGRRGVRIRDPLALLALLGLLRAIGDPLPQAYYFLALLIPLAVWEVTSVGRLPLVTVLATAFVGVVPGAESHLGSGLTSTLTLAGAGSLAVYLAWHAVVSPSTRRTEPAWGHVTFSARWRSSSPLPANHTAQDSPASSKAFRPG